MLPYILLLAGICVFGYFLCEYKKARWRDLTFLLTVSVVLIVFATIRGSTVGVDYKNYLNYFSLMHEKGSSFFLSAADFNRFEPLYGLFNFLVSRISGSPLVFAGCYAVLTVSLTAVFLWRYCSSVWLGMFVFLSFGFYSYTLCTLRQQLAICIFLFALPYLQRKKLLPYLAIVVVAALFHRSMWILIPVYWIAWIPSNWKSITFYSVGTLLLIIFSNPFFDFVTHYIFRNYTENSYYRMVGRDFPTAIIPIVVYIVALIMQKKLLRRNPANLPLINFAGYACFLFIATLRSFLFQRIALIFLPVAMLLLPEILAVMQPEPAKMQELSQLKQRSSKNKAIAAQYIELKLQMRDAKTAYYSTIGFILAGGWLYYLFLLVANRLLLVPYVTIFF